MKDGTTPAHRAAQGGHLEVLRLLLQAGPPTSRALFSRKRAGDLEAFLGRGEARCYSLRQLGWFAKPYWCRSPGPVMPATIAIPHWASERSGACKESPTRSIRSHEIIRSRLELKSSQRRVVRSFRPFHARDLRVFQDLAGNVASPENGTVVCHRQTPNRWGIRTDQVSQSTNQSDRSSAQVPKSRPLQEFMPLPDFGEHLKGQELATEARHEHPKPRNHQIRAGVEELSSCALASVLSVQDGPLRHRPNLSNLFLKVAGVATTVKIFVARLAAKHRNPARVLSRFIASFVLRGYFPRLLLLKSWTCCRVFVQPAACPPFPAFSCKCKTGLHGAWSFPPPPQHSGRHVECKRDVVMSQKQPASPIRFVQTTVKQICDSSDQSGASIARDIGREGLGRSALRLAPAMLNVRLALWATMEF